MGLFDKLKQTVGNEPLGKVNGKKAKQAKEAKEKNTESHLSRPNRKKVKKSYKSLFHSDKKDNPKKEMKDNDLTFMKNNKNKKVQSTASMDTMKKEMLNGYSEGDSEDPTKYIKSNSLGGRNKAMILQSLHIEDNKPLQCTARELGIHLLTPDEAENVQFDISTPSGVKLEQVEEYCDLVTSNISLLIERINKLSDDKNKLIDEIQRVENKALKDIQSQQMDQILTQGNSERDQLKDELLNLKISYKKLSQENKALQNQLKTTQSNNVPDNLVQENKKLKDTINQLKLELDESRKNASETPKENDELNKALDEIKNLKLEREKLIQKIPETEKELNRKNDELSKLKSELAKSQQIVNEKKQQLEQANIRNNKLSKNLNKESLSKDNKPNPQVMQENRTTITKKKETGNTQKETEDEYEKRIIASVSKKNKFKHVRPLSKEQTRNMLKQLHASEKDDDIKIKGINTSHKSQTTGDSAFDNMMDELNSKD